LWTVVIVQLLVSTFLLWKESNTPKPPRITTDWRSIGLYPIPSIIYLIHNNVQFATLTYVDTSTYQIMGNLKIVTTAILFRSAIEFQKAFANVINLCCSHE
jgi:UDP-sugar transporter A1/2/3